jgi:hypothetical protein
MRKLLLLSFALLPTACVTPYADQAPKTQLQVREFQTRSFETCKTDDVLSAVVEAFQDEGFMVKNVVPQVGLISASREADVEDMGNAALRTIFWGQQASWQKNLVVEATANVKTLQGKTKVRVTFQKKILNNHGGTDEVYTVEDPKFYQEFFDKVGKSIFIEKQKI